MTAFGASVSGGGSDSASGYLEAVNGDIRLVPARGTFVAVLGDGFSESPEYLAYHQSPLTCDAISLRKLS